MDDSGFALSSVIAPTLRSFRYFSATSFVETKVFLMLDKVTFEKLFGTEDNPEAWR